ncbi:glycosyltransferase family 2 protein [Weissella confusa]|uniref:glycosyltransferase family 2 protein n=1 Tax=Weissella confusa TaxID=1583 RepID=UPI0022E4882A|nr:glycosyltransferase family 2 protein [Weissella confusa]
MPLISVVMPVYNVENYVGEAIESILDQLTDWELIIINDGSTDSSEKVVKEYLSDSRIKYWRIDNSGLSVARNTGLKYATGDYVYFMDSDDILRKNVFKILEPILINKNPDGVSLTYEEFDSENGEIVKKVSPQEIREIQIRNRSEILIDLMNDKIDIMAWSYMVKRALLIDNGITYTPNVLFEDNNSAPKIFSAGYSYLLIKFDVAPYLYRRRSGSIMSDFRTRKTARMLRDDVFVSQDAYKVYLKRHNNEAKRWYFNKLNLLYLDYYQDLSTDSSCLPILNSLKNESKKFEKQAFKLDLRERIRFMRVQNIFFDKLIRKGFGMYYGRN